MTCYHYFDNNNASKYYVEQPHNTVYNMEFKTGFRKRIKLKQLCVVTLNNSWVKFRWLSFEISVTFHNSSKSSKSPYDITENVFNTFLTAGNSFGSVPGMSLYIYRQTSDNPNFWILKIVITIY